MTSLFPTSFNFVLPKGLIDSQGSLHRQGRMRLATAKDEIICSQHPDVQSDPGYSTLVMLAQVVEQLGDLDTITPELLENLFRPDFQYLKLFYEQIHQGATPELTAQCPQCQHRFSMGLTPSEKP
ncbi:phage tail assembly protein [Leptolyngbya cf. ectocarpi LEGE 11479]|uniref:Phage tail assembly protein n=2 Tax=Leptolyngbya ectocarpi TaxID=1202 RepID=A0A928ZZV2_LEPEC|nr:phage tail assembly protein [Leptolyngbya cf. ectocarpi LEGE 11479]